MVIWFKFDTKTVIKVSQNIQVLNISVNNIFPMEILELIVNYGDLKASTMLMINKTFFITFSSKLYKSLHLTIVLSKLTKMKLNDTNFLKYGPDLLNIPCDSYSIYERNKNSKKFDYEFLDTEIIPDQILNDKLYDDLDHEHPRTKTPTEVRSFSKIIHIIEAIIHNPNSKMRCFIKEVIIDICILDGFKELFGIQTEGSNLIRELVTKTQNKDIISASSSANNRTKVIPIDDTFQRNRWNDSFESYEKFKEFSARTYTDPKKSKIFNIFPQNVYFKELLTIYLTSINNYPTELRRSLFHIQNRTHLDHCNHFRYWEKLMRLKSTRPIYNRSNPKTRQNITFNSQLCVDITKREFKTKEDTNDFLQNLIKIFGNPSYVKTSDFRSSILITGPRDCKPEISHQFTQDVIFGSEELVNYDMFMILLNKGCHNS
ncbi:hypothetical protein BN7_333 [Wickerhamomyces ciferrii]|uniref:Uncharacterized protein n=1 Tax=Wickerhamomyces ciferrii (strain ATCC 14091 / BCRC 22168 / CBS 111 / JCM 3599 / NBRC 0793 / NRRL Y-1031 F-60-10) TaxID=1206466 RepID=K0KHH4_WICCF|nr:uncharacterized protein BN7_333 [Wickerhamomyces ciferrii]CCH40799.1 hypothetical protein BN7_333 [Wickerhamomyces ciferrii]